MNAQGKWKKVNIINKTKEVVIISEIFNYIIYYHINYMFIWKCVLIKYLENKNIGIEVLQLFL